MLREGRAYLSGFRDELEQLLALNLDEDALREFLRAGHHSNSGPTLRSSKWRLWVEHLRDRVDQLLMFRSDQLGGHRVPELPHLWLLSFSNSSDCGDSRALHAGGSGPTRLPRARRPCFLYARTVK